MSLLVFETDDATIPVGMSVVLDEVTKKVRLFIPATDDDGDIIGVVYPKLFTTGRLTGSPDGECFYKYDYFAFDETLAYAVDSDGNYTVNPDWDLSFNVHDNPNYLFVAVFGLTAVLKTAVVNTAWKKLRDGVNYDLYLVR